MYRVGLPFWKLLARCGMPVHLRIMVQRDSESDMLVATSPDLDGVVVESTTMDDLMIETREVIDMLLEEYLSTDKHAEPEFRMRDFVEACH